MCKLASICRSRLPVGRISLWFRVAVMPRDFACNTQYILLIMPESWKIWGPTWVKNRSWTSFLSHLEPLGVSETDSQCIFRPDWAHQSSEGPRNSSQINRFPLIVPEWLKRNAQYVKIRASLQLQLLLQVPTTAKITRIYKEIRKRRKSLNVLR